MIMIFCRTVNVAVSKVYRDATDTRLSRKSIKTEVHAT